MKKKEKKKEKKKTRFLNNLNRRSLDELLLDLLSALTLASLGIGGHVASIDFLDQVLDIYLLLGLSASQARPAAAVCRISFLQLFDHLVGHRVLFHVKRMAVAIAARRLLLLLLTRRVALTVKGRHCRRGCCRRLLCSPLLVFLLNLLNILIKVN